MAVSDGAEMIASIHPSVRDQVIDWLDEAAVDAADDLLYPNPHLALALQSLADELRRAPHIVITTNPKEHP